MHLVNAYPKFDFGIAREEFKNSVFEKKPYLRRSCFQPAQNYWETIDAALSLQDPTYEMLKVILGRRISPDQYMEKYIDIGIRRRRIKREKLYQLVSAGASLVLNRIELVSPTMQNICMEVSRLIGVQTTGNCYA